MHQISRLLTLCVVFISAITINSCAVNPVSGNREIVLMSVEQEKQIGAENNQQIKEQMGFIDDPALLDYIRKIGNRLAKYSPYQDVKYHFQIVDSADPNAFALPGGYVYVSRGLLVLVNSEDELAGVIGHEIGHVAARHAVQRLTRAAPLGLVTGITSAAAGIVSPSLANAVSGTGNLLNSAILAPYSRGQENDADEIGQELTAKAGWDPEGIALFLKTLGRETSRQGNGGESISFLSTHPSTPDRVKATEKRANDFVFKRDKLNTTNHKAFLEKFNGLLVGPDARQGVFINQEFLQPTMNFGITFPAGWETVNQPDYVAAVTKEQDALVILQIQGKGNDPLYAARSFLNEAKLGKQPVQKVTIGGYPAGQTMLYHKGQETIITWIAFHKQVYRLTGVSKNSKVNHIQIINKTVSTFHQLNSDERAKIRQLRLRIVTAREGERLKAILKRFGSTWDEVTSAVANNLQTDVSLKKGQLIKVAIPEALK